LRILLSPKNQPRRSRACRPLACLRRLSPRRSALRELLVN
jgi:hypothetical protein